MVFPNGESVERAVYVWGETLEEILDSATIKLGLWGQAKIVYNMEGKKVLNIVWSIEQSSLQTVYALREQGKVVWWLECIVLHVSYCKHYELWVLWYWIFFGGGG